MNGFFVRSFGCRASQADGAALADGLREKGLEAAAEREAGLVVLNTCTVTAAADEEIRHAVRQVQRENPAARILVTGCYAQRAPEEIAALEGVTWVVGNTHKARIPERMAEGDEGAPYHGQIQVSDLFAGPSEFFAAAVKEAGGERHAAESEDSGRVQQPVLILHDSVRARAEPERNAGVGGGAGAGAGGDESGSGAERDQPGAMGAGAGRRDAAGGAGAAVAGGDGD